MNVEIGTETSIFLFWEYLFRKFGILSLQCVGTVPEDKIKKRFDTAAGDRGSSERYISYVYRMTMVRPICYLAVPLRQLFYLANGFIMSILHTCVWYRSFSMSSPMKMPVPEVPPTNRFLQEQPLKNQYCTVYT
jgi:hypothetical protein